MEVLADEQQLCPCYREYQEFQRLMELNDSGLEIYLHRICAENIEQGEAIDSSVNSSRDVFILHNKKDMKITTSQLTLENKYVSCSRCRKILEHAQELMKELKTIDRKVIMGICDHCRKRALVSKKSFCVCDKIVKMYISLRAVQTEDIKKYVKLWPSKKEHVRKDSPKEIRGYSNIQINQDLASPATGNGAEVNQVFFSVTRFGPDNREISGTGLKSGYVKTSSVQPIKPKKTTFDYTPHEIINTKKPDTSSVDLDTSLVKTNVGVKEPLRPSIKRRKQDESFLDTPSRDAKAELKRRHDLSLRQMMKSKKDSGFDESKTPDVYGTTKVESEMDIKKVPKRTPRDLDTRSADYAPGHSVGKVRKLEQRGMKSKSRSMEAQFSYVFPKPKEKKVKKISVKSSELIKTTREKLKERRGKLEQEQKINLSQEKKKPQAEEQTKIAEEQQRLVEKDKSRKAVLGKKRKSEVAKKESKPEQQDAVEDKSKEKDEKEEKLKTKKEKRAKPEEEEKLIIKKGESDKKLKQGKREGKQLLTKSEKLLKKRQLEKEKRIQGELTKEVSPKTGKATTTKPDSSGHMEISTSNMDNINTESKMITKKKKGGKSSTEKLTAKERKELGQFEKLQAKHLKEKEEALKKKQLEAQKASEAERELKMTDKLIKQAKSNDYLKLVKLKHSKIRPLDIDFELLRAHTAHNKGGQKLLTCPLCWDSELELEVYSLDNERNKKKDTTAHIIIGEKIFKYKPRIEKPKKTENVPIFLQKDIFLETDLQLKGKVSNIPQELEPVQKRILATDLSKKDEKENELELGKGVIHYALSDRTFIDKGWTVLPTEKVVRMMNVYRMRPAHPEFDWFEHNKNKRLMTYDTGERLAEFDDNGRGRWYYRSGRLALDYYDAEEINAKQRFVVYSSGEPDERGRTHPITVLATFDYLGNGIVFDHAGKIRLKYNQSEGVVLDRTIGPVSHWKWHTLNDPPVLQQVMIDTQMAHKDPNILKLGSSDDNKPRPDNEEMLAIEFDNFIKDKTRKLSQKVKPFQIKMKALKINEHFSLKVLDQATVYLIFRDGLTNLKVNMGMILDDKEIVDTDTAEVGEVSNSLERLPARTESLAGLQRSVAYAQRYERQHAERDRRLRFTEPCASADLMTAAASPPMRLPLITVPTVSTSTARYCSRKPSNNLYYDTRLFC